MKQDSSWRRILDKLLPEFFGFYFREIHRAIEVQGQRQSDFAQRVYSCNYRIFDRFGEKVISVVLLSDDDPKFRENIYEVSQLGFRLHFEFPMVKLLDYWDKWEELERDSNPFAIVTMAFLKTVETEGNDQERYHWKKHFLLELYRRGMSRETILALYEFIDIVMALPEAKDDELNEDLKQTTEENKMSIITTAERVGMKKGREEGREEGLEEGLKEAISDILELKFGVVGLELLEYVEQVTASEILRKIRLGLKGVQSIAEAEAVIRAHVPKRSEETMA